MFYIPKFLSIWFFVLLFIYTIGYLGVFSHPFFSLNSPMYFLSFYGRKIAPVLLLLGFLALSYVRGQGKISKLLSCVTGGVLGGSIFVTCILAYGYFMGIPFESFSHNGNWNYIPMFEYALFLFVGFFFVGRKIGFNYYSFFLVGLALFASGFLYELPVIWRATAYAPLHFLHAFFVEPTIIAFALLIFMLFVNKRHFGKLQLVTGIFFVVYSVAIFSFILDPTKYAFVFPLDYPRPSLAMWVLEGWLPRIPSLAFLISLVYGVEKT